jgi:carbohydrate-binding DOMON domain-containing protein
MNRAIWIVLVCLYPAVALAGSVVLKDPAGDDNGPGDYVYPTASEYKKGSFDFTKVEIKDKGDKLQIKLHVKAKVEDPWKSRDWPTRGNGFSLQMAFLFVDTDHKPGSGHKSGLPGLNVRFQEDARWEKVVVISPQGNTRLKSEINTKAREFKDAIVLPAKVKVSGKKIIATVRKKDLGEPAAGWGYQLVMQSNEGYPDSGDLLTRKVNEVRGEHRFGGGRDDDCDPHVIDILVPPAKGDKGEVSSQHEILKKSSCTGDKGSWKLAELPMVYPG